MRYGVIADIHANLAALETCLNALQKIGVDRLVCLGDIVGYGPQPNEVVSTIVENDIPCVAGNHDRVAAGLDDIDLCGSSAKPTLEWTREAITDEVRAALRELPSRLELEGDVLAAHGSITDPWRYIRRVPDAVEQLNEMTEARSGRILLLGHTHRQMTVDLATGKVATSEWLLARKRRVLELNGTAFVNPGSVGQPREPRALVRFAVLDLNVSSAALHALPYPHERCVQALRSQGLPPKWSHPRPTVKKAIRQALRDAKDRREGLHHRSGPTDVPSRR